MIRLLMAAVMFLTGCATTTIFDHGQVVAVIQADATNVTIKTKTLYFHADSLNHSDPTRAGGAVFGQAVSGMVPIITALGAAGL